MKRFREHLEENRLEESSLSRIKDHIDNHDTGAITAFRDKKDENGKPLYTKADNMRANKQLLAWLMSKGYGVTTVKGSYVMNFGTDSEREVGETSFFVVDINDTGKLHQDLIYLGGRFKQESVILINKGGGNARLYGTMPDSMFPEYRKEIPVGKGKFGKASGEFFSRIRGRVFAFEQFNGRMGRWGASLYAAEVDRGEVI